MASEELTGEPRQKEDLRIEVMNAAQLQLSQTRTRCNRSRSRRAVQVRSAASKRRKVRQLQSGRRTADFGLVGQKLGHGVQSCEAHVLPKERLRKTSPPPAYERGRPESAVSSPGSDVAVLPDEDEDLGKGFAGKGLDRHGVGGGGLAKEVPRSFVQRELSCSVLRRISREREKSF